MSVVMEDECFCILDRAWNQLELAGISGHPITIGQRFIMAAIFRAVSLRLISHQRKRLIHGTTL